MYIYICVCVYVEICKPPQNESCILICGLLCTPSTCCSLAVGSRGWSQRVSRAYWISALSTLICMSALLQPRYLATVCFILMTVQPISIYH